MGRERRSWTDLEDELLRAAVSTEDPDNDPPSRWNAIARHVPNRTNKDCRKRWFSKMASVVTKGGWSYDEDRRLLDAVEKHGTKWSAVAALVQTRNSDQCAKRWGDTLNPSIDRTMWSPEEDAQLFEAVKIHGRAWTKIAKLYFPGRTGLSAKNRHNRLARSPAPHSTRTRRRQLTVRTHERPSASSPTSPSSSWTSPSTESSSLPSTPQSAMNYVPDSPSIFCTSSLPVPVDSLESNPLSISGELPRNSASDDTVPLWNAESSDSASIANLFTDGAPSSNHSDFHPVSSFESNMNTHFNTSYPLFDQQYLQTATASHSVCAPTPDSSWAFPPANGRSGDSNRDLDLFDFSSSLFYGIDDKPQSPHHNNMISTSPYSIPETSYLNSPFDLVPPNYLASETNSPALSMRSSTESSSTGFHRRSSTGGPESGQQVAVFAVAMCDPSNIHSTAQNLVQALRTNYGSSVNRHSVTDSMFSSGQPVA